MLRPSRINPVKSAYNKLWGNFDFNKTPLAPPGCLIVAHEWAQERGSWADHGVKGYFIGPAKHHYRNYRVYILATRGERTIDTIKFFPQHVQMPKKSSEDWLASATKDHIAILKKPHPPTPFLDQGTKTNDAIQKLQEIFTPRQLNEASTRVKTCTYKGDSISYKDGITNTRGKWKRNNNNEKIQLHSTNEER